MNTSLNQLKADNLHHAYIMFGEREKNKKELFGFLKTKLSIDASGNPNCLVLDYNILTIDEARYIVSLQQMRGVGEFGSLQMYKKFFIVSIHGMTEEAQNALLKVFEEPATGTHFFILASQNTFLPTFLSRVLVIHTPEQKPDPLHILDLTIPERLSLVHTLVDDISDEKKIKQDAINLVNTVETELYEKGILNNRDALRHCIDAREMILSRGAMVKMILENLLMRM